MSLGCCPQGGFCLFGGWGRFGVRAAAGCCPVPGGSPPSFLHHLSWGDPRDVAGLIRRESGHACTDSPGPGGGNVGEVRAVTGRCPTCHGSPPRTSSLWGATAPLAVSPELFNVLPPWASGAGWAPGNPTGRWGWYESSARGILKPCHREASGAGWTRGQRASHFALLP